MANRLRSLLYLMMFGIFLSNNIIVPVHKLAHIQASHEYNITHGHHVQIRIAPNDRIEYAHNLAHNHDEHNDNILNCDVFHVIPALAQANTTYAINIPPRAISITTAVIPRFKSLRASTGTEIRAPPVYI